MFNQVDDKLPKSSDSFYDDNDHTAKTPPSFISGIRIATTKPPVYHEQNQSSNSLSSLSDSSEYDITNVSSIRKQYQHPFHLESMRHVLFGLSTPTSRSSSPSYSSQQQLNKKDLDSRSDNVQKQSRHHYQQPYIHNSRNDYHRTRLTSSAINRQKQQQRIERENLKILERLQCIRPSRSLKRDELLSNYNHQMGVITYTTEPRFRLSSRPSSATTISSTFPVFEKNGHTQNRLLSSTHSSSNNIVHSRPVSASNPSSSARKPLWNARWQQQE